MGDHKNGAAEFPLPLQCPHCEHYTEQLIGDLKAFRRWTCEACGHAVRYSYGDLVLLLDRVDDILERYRRGLN